MSGAELDSIREDPERQRCRQREERDVTRSHADLMATQLDEAVLDPSASLADVLRICMMLGIRIRATSLRQWAAAQ